MLEIKGEFNTAKVFTDIIDEDSIRQIYELCNQSFAEGAKIRMNVQWRTRAWTIL